MNLFLLVLLLLVVFFPIGHLLVTRSWKYVTWKYYLFMVVAIGIIDAIGRWWSK
jgi:hypothetical protein